MNKFKILLLSIVILAFAAGLPTDDLGRIAGGTLAASGEFPWVVSISENSKHICGGFIYNDRNIVTTASCVVGRTIPSLKVKVGAISLITPEPQEQNINVLSVVPYPTYDAASKLHDLAIVQIDRPIVFGNSAKAIRYEELDEFVSAATIAGWGATTDGGLNASKLRKATISNLMADCRFYGSDQYFSNYMICAGDGSNSPCEYDQGSPLVQASSYGNIVVGIMSKNDGCVTPYPPSIYTRLGAYYSWLLQNAGQQPANI